VKPEDENQGILSIASKSQIKNEMILTYNSTPFTIIMAEIEMKFLRKIYKIFIQYLFINKGTAKKG
jgi:hypothetical protein